MNDKLAWIDTVRAHGMENMLGAALDALEPFGALAAQALWVLQPGLGLLLPRAALEDVAHALEEPGGIERLRASLFED